MFYTAERRDAKVLSIAVFLVRAREKGLVYPRSWDLQRYRKLQKWYKKLAAEKERRRKNEQVKRDYRLK